MAGMICVGVDGSERGREALRFALTEARLRDATVHAVHAWVFPPFTASATGMIPVYGLLAADLARTAEALLEGQIERLGAATDGIRVERFVERGAAADVLVRHAEEADLLVVGSHGRGAFTGLLLGSVSEACVHHASCPVAVVQVVHHAERGRIVVGVDGSAGSRTALEWATAEAKLRGAAVHVVVAYETEWGPVVPRLANEEVFVELQSALGDDARRVLEDTLASVPSGVPATGETVCSAPAQALVEAASHGDLLVVGSRGHGGFARLLLGSVSRACAAAGPGVTIVVPQRARTARRPAAALELTTA